MIHKWCVSKNEDFRALIPPVTKFSKNNKIYFVCNSVETFKHNLWTTLFEYINFLNTYYLLHLLFSPFFISSPIFITFIFFIIYPWRKLDYLHGNFTYFLPTLPFLIFLFLTSFSTLYNSFLIILDLLSFSLYTHIYIFFYYLGSIKITEWSWMRGEISSINNIV